MTSYKIVITGPFNSGKTQFVQTISDIDVVSTERKITSEDRGIKSETTVAMDYGRVNLDGVTLYLYGTPGQTRFDFMQEILSAKLDAFVLLIDAADPLSFPHAEEIMSRFAGFTSAPYIVAANKMDLAHARKLEEVRKEARVPSHITIMPCVAHQKSSVRQVLLQILGQLQS